MGFRTRFCVNGDGDCGYAVLGGMSGAGIWEGRNPAGGSIDKFLKLVSKAILKNIMVIDKSTVECVEIRGDPMRFDLRNRICCR